MSIHAILEALDAAVTTIDPLIQQYAGELKIELGVEAPPWAHDDLSMRPIVEELARYVRPATPRAYVCHPVSAFKSDGSYDLEGMRANLANARKWLRWLVDNTNWAVSMPWMPYVEELDEETYRERGIEDDLVLNDGHSVLVLVSDRASSGMVSERSYAEARMIPVIDLTMFGCFEPPARGTEAFNMLRTVLDTIMPGTVRPLAIAA